MRAPLTGTAPSPKRYRVVDMARKVVGVGSVGARAWIILLEGRDSDDPLVLQAEEAQASVLEAHVGRSKFTNQANGWLSVNESCRVPAISSGL